MTWLLGETANSPAFWDWFHDVSTAALVLTVFLTLDTVRRLQQRVRALERSEAARARMAEHTADRCRSARQQRETTR